jgi:hypothetical protein
MDNYDVPRSILRNKLSVCVKIIVLICTFSDFFTIFRCQWHQWTTTTPRKKYWTQ